MPEKLRMVDIADARRRLRARGALTPRTAGFLILGHGDDLDIAFDQMADELRKRRDIADRRGLSDVEARFVAAVDRALARSEDPAHPYCQRCGELFRPGTERAEIADPSSDRPNQVIHQACMRDTDVLS